LNDSDEIEDRLNNIKKMSSKLISSGSPGKERLEGLISKSEIPKLNISFPSFLLNENSTN